MKNNHATTAISKPKQINKRKPREPIASARPVQRLPLYEKKDFVVPPQYRFGREAPLKQEIEKFLEKPLSDHKSDRDQFSAVFSHKGPQLWVNDIVFKNNGEAVELRIPEMTVGFMEFVHSCNPWVVTLTDNVSESTKQLFHEAGWRTTGSGYGVYKSKTTQVGATTAVYKPVVKQTATAPKRITKLDQEQTIGRIREVILSRELGVFFDMCSRKPFSRHWIDCAAMSVYLRHELASPMRDSPHMSETGYQVCIANAELRDQGSQIKNDNVAHLYFDFIERIHKANPLNQTYFEQPCDATALLLEQAGWVRVAHGNGLLHGMVKRTLNKPKQPPISSSQQDRAARKVERDASSRRSTNIVREAYDQAAVSARSHEASKKKFDRIIKKYEDGEFVPKDIIDSQEFQIYYQNQKRDRPDDGISNIRKSSECPDNS